MNAYEWNRRWEELDDALRNAWGPDQYERRAFTARRVLDAGGPSLLRALAELPVSAAVQIAQAYAAVGLRESRMTVPEVHLASEYLADRASPYHQKGQDPEVNAGAKVLVAELMEAAAGGQVPADPQAPVQPDAGELPVEVQEQARTLMADPAYWSKAHPKYAAVHRQVEGLLASASAPAALGARRSQAPARDPKAEAAELMRGEAYWSAGHPQSQAVRAQVKHLLSEAFPEPLAGEAGEGGETHG